MEKHNGRGSTHEPILHFSLYIYGNKSLQKKGGKRKGNSQKIQGLEKEGELLIRRQIGEQVLLSKP